MKKIGSALAKALKEKSVPYRARRNLTPGFMIRHFRELQGLSQNQLADLTGIPQAAISSLECGRIALGLDRAKVLAAALRIHPAVLAFPSWEAEREALAV